MPRQDAQFANQGAEADFNQAIALNPDDAEAYINRGILRYILKDSQSAIADLQTAAQLFMTLSTS